MIGLRVAARTDLTAAAEALGVPPAALAPALLEPSARLLVGDGSAVLLRRQWNPQGDAEVVVVHGPGLPIGHPDVLRAAAAWGCGRVWNAPRSRSVDVPGPADGAPLADRFRHLAALAATRVEVAVALAHGQGREHTKSDGSPSLPADEAAQVAAARVLGALGVPLLSEERRDRAVAPDQPWIVLDPLDGTGNFAAGLPPWAFSAALVQSGRPLAGLVVDLSSGRRWEGATGAGAWRDGVPVRPRAGTTVLAPTAPPGQSVLVPPPARRVRVTGCTAVDLCLVADGAAAAWHDLDRGGTHAHDVAGGLSILLAAGGVVLTPEGQPLQLHPDTETPIRFVAAATAELAEQLRAAFVAAR